MMHSIYFLKNNTGRVKRPYHIQKEYSRMIHKEIPEKFFRNDIAQQMIISRYKDFNTNAPKSVKNYIQSMKKNLLQGFDLPYPQMYLQLLFW